MVLIQLIFWAVLGVYFLQLFNVIDTGINTFILFGIAIVLFFISENLEKNEIQNSNSDFSKGINQGMGIVFGGCLMIILIIAVLIALVYWQYLDLSFIDKNNIPLI